MATTKDIIDSGLLGVEESDVTNPQSFTRAGVLALYNITYQEVIGALIKDRASFSYDGSDAAHTITAGVGTLPTDFLGMDQVYDGDAPDNNPLEQIFKIEDKVSNTDSTTQYMLPTETDIWIFGQTPTNTIKLYYYKRPTALADTTASIPTALKARFHLGPESIFDAVLRAEYAKRNNNAYKEDRELAKYDDLLREIEYAHTAGKRDSSPQNIKDVFGGR